MATRIKRIYKGIKYMTQIFVVKEEREIEIGAPTDVKHIAHIGWEGSSGNPPSWMNEFKTKPKAPPTPNTILNVNVNGNGNGNVNANGNAKIEKTKGSISWSSQDFESLEILDTPPPVREILDVIPTRDIPKKKKKKRRQSKSKSMSIPNSINTTRPVATKSKTKLVIEGNARPESIQVI